jgi:hypothetical protein
MTLLALEEINMVKDINTKLFISDIQFNKTSVPKKGLDLNSTIKYDYSSKYTNEQKNATVKIDVAFRFDPEALVKGNIVYNLDISSKGEIIDERIITEIVASLESRIACEVSYLVTVCIDMMYGIKTIIPPRVSKS